jgi:bacteriorhodopsin
MGILFERANDALNVNPPGGDQYLTENGSNWLFAATALFLLAFVSVLYVSL